MKLHSVLLLLALWTSLASAQPIYFPPPQANSVWESSDLDALGWCSFALPPLLEFLEASNTKAFIVLKDGKIVIEEYFGTFTADSTWYWASAGKSLTSFLVGRAQQEGLLDINAPSSTYLGTGWTSLTPQQELAITVRNQLSMTSGLDDGIPNNNDCTEPACLQYLAEPGTRWAYHNGPYTLLDGVLQNATGVALNSFVFTRLTQTTGIAGAYVQVGQNNVFFSKARAMARFGLLMQGEAAWAGNPILSDMAYYNAMITPSQSMNSAYGYLWWLNSQSSFMLPGIQFPFQGPFMSNAPEDVFAAMGKNGQIINVSPSKGLVVVRMGNLPGGIFVPNQYNDEIWQYLNSVLCPLNGIASKEHSGLLQAWPNPARESLELQLAPLLIRGELQVLDALGRVVITQQVSIERERIDVSGLKAGSYMIALHSDAGNAALRFVKE